MSNVTLTGDIRTDMMAFLQQHGRHDAVHHSLQVGALARELAEQFDVIPSRAEIAGWLHDLSVVIPRAQYLAVAQACGVKMLPEERQCPTLLHQKLSEVIARDVFHITDEGILSAIGCHITMKLGMLPLDKVVFLADKIVWDQSNTPPCLTEMIEVLYQMPSLDAALKAYSDYIWEHQRDHEVTAHSWFVDKSRSMEQV